MNNTLIIYCYYEKNEDYKQNLLYFLNFGIIDTNDYIFIINGHSTVEIIENNNIKVNYRNNIGYDFGAYGEVLKSIDLNNYKYYFFINTSVRGPFLPNYIKINWTQPFLDLFKDDVKIVGTTINLCNYKGLPYKNILDEQNYYIHVQSQVFVVDYECLIFLISKGIFDINTENNFEKIIVLKEVKMSQLILKNNWNISCLLPEYQNFDYRTLNVDFNPTSQNGEMNYLNMYFNRTAHPYEVIFIKMNRNLLNNQINSISTFNYNKKLNTIIFIFYYNYNKINSYINKNYIYLVKISNYYEIYDFLLSNSFLWFNKLNVGIILFNDLKDINIVNNINKNDLVIISNNNKIDNFNINLWNNLLNYLNINDFENFIYKHFTSYIVKKKYFIELLDLYKNYVIFLNKYNINNINDINILLIKLLSYFFNKLQIKKYI